MFAFYLGVRVCFFKEIICFFFLLSKMASGERQAIEQNYNNNIILDFRKFGELGETCDAKIKLRA